MTTNGWIDVASLDTINKGDALVVELSDRKIAVVHVADGRCFAIDAVCSHGRALLSDGFVDGLEIECPKHNGRFNLETGEAVASPAREALGTYPCRVRDGRVEVAP